MRSIVVGVTIYAFSRIQVFKFSGEKVFGENVIYFIRFRRRNRKEQIKTHAILWIVKCNKKKKPHNFELVLLVTATHL